MEKQAYILLDRDGVINQERGKHTFMPEDFVWVDGFWQGLHLLQQKGYRFAIITNQSGIAQGFYTHDHVAVLHQKIWEQAKAHHIHLDEILYCPHHPSMGKCLCRKPLPLLYERLIARFNIDVAHSWMIGDKERDVLPAQKLGFHTLQIVANTNFVHNTRPILHG